MTKVAIIPARAGSKRLPHKNRMTINNKSLVEITIICAIESGVFDDIIVSTDDDYFFKLNTIPLWSETRVEPCKVRNDIIDWQPQR